jgi:hypothetical protein
MLQKTSYCGQGSSSCVESHCQKWFIPVAVFAAEDLLSHIAAMELVQSSPVPKHLQTHTEAQPTPQNMCSMVPYTQEMCRYQVWELTDDVFFEKWSKQEPFVLTGITESRSPHDLLDLKHNRRKQCKTSFYDGQTWQTNTSTLGTYFKTWKTGQLSNFALQIRVRSNVLSYSVLTSG